MTDPEARLLLALLAAEARVATGEDLAGAVRRSAGLFAVDARRLLELASAKRAAVAEARPEDSDKAKSAPDPEPRQRSAVTEHRLTANGRPRKHG